MVYSLPFTVYGILQATNGFYFFRQKNKKTKFRGLANVFFCFSVLLSKFKDEKHKYKKRSPTILCGYRRAFYCYVRLAYSISLR